MKKRRKYKFVFWANEEERQIILENAEKCHLEIGSYIRFIIFSAKVLKKPSTDP